jgi:hypothetical protein
VVSIAEYSLMLEGQLGQLDEHQVVKVGKDDIVHEAVVKTFVRLTFMERSEVFGPFPFAVIPVMARPKVGRRGCEVTTAVIAFFRGHM